MKKSLYALVIALLAAPTILYMRGYWQEDVVALINRDIAQKPSAAGSDSVDLFDDFGIQQVQKALPKKAKISRSVNVHGDLLALDTITLNLFNDVIVTAVRDRLIDNVNGSTTWIGHVQDEKESEVYLTIRGQTVSGTVQIGANNYEIEPKGNNKHDINQIDTSKNPKHSTSQSPEDFLQTGGQPAPTGSQTSTTSTTSPTTSAATAGTVIDLMVAYTPKALTNAGGQAGIEAKIVNAVAMANQAYLNSQVDMQLNLVKMVQTNYAETGDMSVSLTRLTGTADSYMDEIHSLRDQAGADQVSLVTADTNYCGIGYMMNSSWLSTAFAPYAFSVVHDDSVYACLSDQTLAHELGHNQGDNHDIANSGTSVGAYSYSYAYRLCQTAGFRTVMSYACTGAQRISYFSNPAVNLSTGEVTGSATENNALSMTNTKAIVAAFRPTATVTTIPNAPSSLSANILSSSEINLAWADNSSDETGFRLERSLDGVTWVEFAVTNSNIIGFSDTGLTAATTYQYRVRAYNSAGSSAYSNTVSAATAAPVVCTGNTPGLTVTSAGGYVKPGATVVLSIALTNQDTSSCGATTFTLTHSDGGTLGSYSLSPATTASASWTVTAPSTDGAYVKTVTASAPSHGSANASANITVDATPPTAPGNLAATVAQKTKIALSWSASSDTGSGFDHYEISRNGTKIASTTSLKYTDAPGKGTYTYTVTAFDKAGNSSSSSKSITL